MELVKINKNEFNFIFKNEDHALGNLLQKQLLKNENVVFAGYLVPHPLETKMMIKLITKDSHNPKEIMNNAFDLILEKLNKYSE